MRLIKQVVKHLVLPPYYYRPRNQELYSKCLLDLMLQILLKVIHDFSLVRVLGVLKPFNYLRLIETACERLRSYLLSEEREGTTVSSKKVSIFGFAIESLGPPKKIIPHRDIEVFFELSVH